MNHAVAGDGSIDLEGGSARMALHTPHGCSMLQQSVRGEWETEDFEMEVS